MVCDFGYSLRNYSLELTCANVGCAGAHAPHHLDLKLNLELGLAVGLADGRREMSRGRSPEPLDFFIWTVEVLICSDAGFPLAVVT